MKKIYPIMCLIAFLSGLQGCSEGDDQAGLTEALQLEGAIGTSTRGVINSGYEADLGVCFARRDEGVSGWEELSAVRIGGGGRTPVIFDIPQFYPDGGRTVSLSGYYPREGWTGGAEGAPVYTLTDGSTDLMATGLLVGAYPNRKLTGCTFRHLLTQLKFVCFSDRPEQWGAVTRIEVEDVYRRQTFRLDASSPVLTPVTSSDVVTLAAIGASAGKAFELYTGVAGQAAQDSILLPAQGGTDAHPLLLHVTTEKGGVGIEKAGGYNHTAALVIKDEEGADGLQAGYSHRVEIAFINSGLEVTNVAVEPWSSVEIKDPLPL